MFFRGRRRQTPSASTANAISLEPIGFVENGVRDPHPQGWQAVESVIRLRDSLDPAVLEGLAGFSHVLVVFVFDRLGSERPNPVTIDVGPVELGILATRSQLRPTPLGVSAVQLLSASDRNLRVRGLDAINSTPVLDLKPYIPFYDSIPNAVVPAWVHGDPGDR